jgi:hypothetical protein
MFTFIDFTSLWLGGPVQLSIFYSWFIVDVPWNNGLPLMIYPIMHPKLQMSISFE